MNSDHSTLQAKAAELRQVFDESFASPERDGRKLVEHMIVIQVGGEPFAVSLREISGLTITKGTILPVPSSVPELVGITGIRGVVVPVFSLSALLGIKSNTERHRWLILSSAAQSTIALAVDLVEGHLEVPMDAFITRASGSGSHYVKQTIKHGEILLRVIDVAMLLGKIRQQGAFAPTP